MFSQFASFKWFWLGNVMQRNAQFFTWYLNQCRQDWTLKRNNMTLFFIHFSLASTALQNGIILNTIVTRSKQLWLMIKHFFNINASLIRLENEEINLDIGHAMVDCIANKCQTSTRFLHVLMGKANRDANRCDETFLLPNTCVFQMNSMQFEPPHSRDKIIDSIKHEQNIYFVGSRQQAISNNITIIFQCNTQASHLPSQLPHISAKIFKPKPRWPIITMCIMRCIVKIQKRKSYR